MGLRKMEGDKYFTSCERLNNRNYGVWSVRMKMILIKEDLWSVIDPGTETDEKKKLKALSHIILMIDDDQLINVSNAKDGKEAWEALKKLNRSETIGHKIRLYKKLFKAELQPVET
jgi:hypothetical protein